MNNIWIITSREYLSRVKKKSFIIMTLLAPLLIAGFYGGIGWMAMNENVGSTEKTIVVLDPTNSFKHEIENPEKLNFIFKEDFSVQDLGNSDSINGLLEVKGIIGNKLELTYQSRENLSVSENDKIQDAFRAKLKRDKLEQLGISQSSIDSLNSRVSIKEFKIDNDGNITSSNIGINTMLGMALAVLIYFFIFLYGVQVMKGVIEEKTNRIVELIVSTVKPFQLMMGKVIGIAAVGLTQIGIWVLLSGFLMTIISLFFGIEMLNTSEMQELSNNPAVAQMDSFQEQAIAAFFGLPLLKIFGTFLFYFIGGYLLYGGLFAAIGSAVDSETDTQQFMLPVTLPLVFSMMIAFSVVINDPNGTLAVWLSLIPISSPIVMMARIPFDPDPMQVVLSMTILVLTILGTIWLAGKIYRTGILMYGKKPSYKELAKWLFYKN
ncbi:MAG: ABC transporter permease [Bacteroidia bacterium]|nr:ABC transporter permease [Bacteroidia bacterium]NNJ56643.1 ABC transporter permease [Bacteroidia bacterium]